MSRLTAIYATEDPVEDPQPTDPALIAPPAEDPSFTPSPEIDPGGGPQEAPQIEPSTTPDDGRPYD